MPDVVLKNAQGEQVLFEDIHTVSLKNDQGEDVPFGESGDSLLLKDIIEGTPGQVVLGSNISTIRSYAFCNCSVTHLPWTIEAPGVTQLNSYAFAQNSSLQQATFGDLSKIDLECFYNCTTLSTISFNSFSGYIGARAFQFCYQLTLDLSGCNISSIGQNAFIAMGQNSESSIVIIDLRNSRDLVALSYGSLTTQNINTDLKPRKIMLPMQLGQLGMYTTAGSYYTNFYFGSSNAPQIESNSFGGVTNSCRILAPYNYLTSYKTSTNWTQTYIQNILLGYAYEGTFTDGQTLPTQDSFGTQLTWYTDTDKTNAVTTCPVGSPELYCWG